MSDSKVFTKDQKWDRCLRPDAQAFDEIRITTVPRYKTSGLSGDEWRISARVQFMRKGEVLHEEHRLRDVETAAQFLPYFIVKAAEECQKTYYAGIYREDGVAICDQEGCSEPATVVYRKRQEFCHKCGHGKDTDAVRFNGEEKPGGGPVRMFCAKHARRGDCGLDDADANYELVVGNPEEPPVECVSQAARLEVTVDSPDDVPDAIREALHGNQEGADSSD